MKQGETAEARSGTASNLRRKLGRGLVSLVSAPVHVDLPVAPKPSNAVARNRVAASPTKPAETVQSNYDQPSPLEPGLQMLVLSDVHPNPRQPRQDFDQESLKALAASISKSGMMQPIVVRTDRNGGYQIIAGERRWRASQLVGLTHIHAVVREVDDKTAAQFSLVENLQREDLNPIERAEAFQRLIDEFGMMHQEIAENVGLERSSVTNHLRLNELDEFSKDAVRAGRLSIGHAKVLLALTNNERRRAIAGQAVQQAWSVRELERRVKEIIDSGASTDAVSDTPAVLKTSTMHPHMADLEKRLTQHLGTKVRIRPGRTKGSGKLIIDFYNLDQFEGLMERLQYVSD